jgi:hypothetical protein
VLTALLAAHGTRAEEIPLLNASFEMPAIPSGTFHATAPPPGWLVYGNGVNFGARTVGVLNPTGTMLYPGGAPDGDNVGVVFLLDDFGNQTHFAGIEAGMQQTLAATLETDTMYTLTVEVGNIGNDPAPPHNQFQFTGFPGYRIDLLAGGVPIASDGSLLPPEGEFLASTLQVAIGRSHPQAGTAIGIRLVNLNSAPGLEVNFDDVRLAADVLGSGSVPDGGRTAGAPLVLDKASGTDITLSWSASCLASDTDYAVYEGTLGDFTSHAPTGSPICSTSSRTSVILTPSAGARYYLVVPQGASYEGSYGDSSTGGRPPSLAACQPQRVVDCPAE